jgi:hypothetical protein
MPAVWSQEPDVTEVVTIQENGRRQILGGTIPQVLLDHGVTSLIYRVWDDYDAQPGDYAWSGMGSGGQIYWGNVVSDVSVVEQLQTNTLGIGIPAGRQLSYTQDSLFSTATSSVNVRQGRGHIASKRNTVVVNYGGAQTSIMLIDSVNDFWSSGRQANRVYKISISGGVYNSSGLTSNSYADTRLVVRRNGIIFVTLEFYRILQPSGIPGIANGSVYCYIDGASSARRSFELTMASTAGNGHAFTIANAPFEMVIEDMGSIDSGQWDGVTVAV